MIRSTFYSESKRPCMVLSRNARRFSKAFLYYTVGKSYSVSISNNECSFAEYPDAKTESELRISAKADIDQVANLTVVIDNVVISGLEKFRFQSPSFFLTLPENNVLGLPAITTQSVSDGFWILLHPLHPGKHEVHFGGSCSADIVKVEATYHLTVES